LTNSINRMKVAGIALAIATCAAPKRARRCASSWGRAALVTSASPGKRGHGTAGLASAALEVQPRTFANRSRPDRTGARLWGQRAGRDRRCRRQRGKPDPGLAFIGHRPPRSSPINSVTKFADGSVGIAVSARRRETAAKRKPNTKPRPRHRAAVAQPRLPRRIPAKIPEPARRAAFLFGRGSSLHHRRV